MTNSDNTFGTYNKETKILTQHDDGSTALTVFGSVTAGKQHFFTTEALAVWDECCTTLEWAVVADDNGDNTKLKVTYDFGTKGAGTEAADDWGSQYNSRLTALEDAGNWAAIPFTTATSSDHLF